MPTFGNAADITIKSEFTDDITVTPTNVLLPSLQSPSPPMPLHSGKKKSEKKYLKECIMNQDGINCNYCLSKTVKSKFVCSICNIKKYCSNECAEKDWRNGAHSLLCSKD